MRLQYQLTGGGLQEQCFLRLLKNRQWLMEPGIGLPHLKHQSAC
jgi:hypothetical protein